MILRSVKRQKVLVALFPARRDGLDSHAHCDERISNILQRFEGLATRFAYSARAYTNKGAYQTNDRSLIEELRVMAKRVT